MDGKKPQDLLLIEQCFASIKKKENILDNLKRISSVLKRMFDYTISINIVDNDTNKFFGMNVYPSEDLIESLVSAIVNGKSNSTVVSELWHNNPNWTIEIDSLLLYDMNLNANPAEITAIMLHELGHVTMSSSVPQRINKIMRFQLLNATYSTQKLCAQYNISRIFNLAIADACSIKNFHFSNIEVDADRFVVKMGYGSELDQLLNKLIATQGNGLINRTDGEIDTEIRSLVNWSIDNISELQFRKGKLKNAIQTEIIKNPSIFMRNMLLKIKTSFFGGDSSAYQKLVTEQNLTNLCAKVVKESVLDWFDNLGKVKKVSQSDIDIISIEMDKIENNDDRIYVLDKIYDLLELIGTGLDCIEKGKTDKVQQSKTTLNNMKNELVKMRDKVMNTQVKDKQYGVFIKYPKGYEG